MDTIVQQGIIGIVTGIVTAVVLFLIKGFWVSKVTPFIIATRYQGVKVEGQWYGSSTNDDPEKGDVFSNEAKLYLTQKAHELTGLFLYSFKNEQKSFSLEFDVTGYIWEGYLTLNFTPKDKRVTSYGTTLLKLHEGGTVLIGEFLFRNVETEFVSQSPLSLGRDLGGS